MTVCRSEITKYENSTFFRLNFQHSALFLFFIVEFGTVIEEYRERRTSEVAAESLKY